MPWGLPGRCFTPVHIAQHFACAIPWGVAASSGYTGSAWPLVGQHLPWLCQTALPRAAASLQLAAGHQCGDADSLAAHLCSALLPAVPAWLAAACAARCMPHTSRRGGCKESTLLRIAELCTLHPTGVGFVGQQRSCAAGSLPDRCWSGRQCQKVATTAKGWPLERSGDHMGQRSPSPQVATAGDSARLPAFA